MPAGRPNVIDSHDDKLLIIRELMKKTSHPKIAAKFGISIDALARYQKRELRRYIVGGVNIAHEQAMDVRRKDDAMVADLIMDDITKIRGNGRTVLEAVMRGMPADGKLTCDPKGFAVVANVLRENAEFQARLEGRLQERAAVVSVVVLTSHAAAPASTVEGEIIDAECECEIPPGS